MKKPFEPTLSENVTMKNGRKAQKAACTTCGTDKILKKEQPQQPPPPPQQPA